MINNYEIQSEFEYTILKSNIRRILIIGTIYTLFEMVGLILSSLGFFESDIRLYVLIVVLFHIGYLPLLFNASKKDFDVKFLTLLENLYYMVILLWASIFTTLVYLEQEDITIYTGVVLLIAAMFIIKPSFSRVIYIVIFAFFSSIIYLNSSSGLIANGLVFKAAIVTVLSIAISNSNFTIRYKLHKSQTDLLSANEKLLELSIRDSLTKLYNNGYIFDYLDNAINASRKYGKRLSLLMIDIDDFKKVNDCYGHLMGDEVIKNISKVLLKQTRDTDVVARYGGEEFIIVLNDTDIDTARLIGERIKKSVENLVHDFEGVVTVSAGVGEWDDEDRASLFKKTDDKLYLAKSKGKNRVE